MLSALEQLLILQDKDTKILRTQRELKAIPMEDSSIAKHLEKEGKLLAEHREKAKYIESERKQIELQVASKQEAINKYRAQQLQTKKNEEYQALGNEIRHAQKSISDMEEKELELMEQYEQAQKEVETEAAKFAEHEKVAQSRRDDLEKKKKVLADREIELQKEIDQLVGEIDPKDLALYRRILKSKGDSAIVPIQNGKICGGCFMQLTHQEVVEARKKQSLVTCLNCGRLIYWS